MMRNAQSRVTCTKQVCNTIQGHHKSGKGPNVCTMAAQALYFARQGSARYDSKGGSHAWRQHAVTFHLIPKRMTNKWLL